MTFHTKNTGTRFFRTLLGVGLFALAMGNPVWALTGTFQDNSGNALANATVKLVVANVSGKTDSSGYFSLLSTSGMTTAASWSETSFITGGFISFTVPQQENVNLSIYSLRGALVGNNQGVFAAGEHALSLSKILTKSSSGLYLVVLRTGSNAQTFRYFYDKTNNNGTVSSKIKSTSQTLNKTAPADTAAIDTLVVSKIIDGVTSTRKLRIYSYKDSINTYLSDGRQILIIDPSNDNDGDGLTNYEERYLYFTNAELTDTDGDGVSDHQEILDGKDPLVANVPDFTFAPVSYPELIAKYATSNGTTSEETISSGGEYTESSTFTTSQELNWKTEVAVMIGSEVELKVDGGAKLSGSLTSTLGVGGSVSFSQEQSESMTENWERSKSYSTSTETTCEGGTIAIDIKLTNNSGQNLTLMSPVVRLSSNGYQASTLETLIGELRMDDDSVYIPAAANQNTVTRRFSATIDNPDLFETLVTKSSGLTVQLQNIHFLTSLGAIDTLMNNVYNRTALVNVDYGDYSASKKLVKKYIVTRNQYNDFYTSQEDRYISSSLAKVLKTAGSTVVCDSTDSHYGIQSIDGLENGAVTKGSWSVSMQARTESDSITVYGTYANYDPSTIGANGHSVITVMYSADTDGDGLSDRTEAVLGTDQTNWDSDGDGLSDGEEVFGWKDAVIDTLWETNPLNRDTDGDGLLDSEDPDPLTAAINPLDSVVSLKSITIIPTQGSSWTSAVTDESSLQLNVAVNSIIRGPATLKLTFDHAINFMRITRVGGKDTLITYYPTNDPIVTYTVKLPLVLGSNSIQVTLYSKNGTQTKVLNLTGINRRLIQIDPTQTALFRVAQPAGSLLGIGADIYMNVDAIRALDPLVNRVVLLRSDIYAAPVNTAKKAQSLIAQDLGDGGIGSARFSAGQVVYGNGTVSNSYRVISVLDSGTSTITNSDSTTKRLNDFIYFPYTANVGGSDGLNYYTAPSTGVGSYYANERTIVLDSIYALLVQKTQYPVYIGLGIYLYYDWQHIVQPSVSIKGTAYAQRSDWTTNGTNNVRIIYLKIDQELNGEDFILGKPYIQNGAEEGWFRINESGNWLNNGSYPDSINLAQIIDPKNYALDTNWTYGAYTANNFADTLWFDHATQGNRATAASAIDYKHPVNYFDNGIGIKWHFKYNDPKKQGN